MIKHITVRVAPYKELDEAKYYAYERMFVDFDLHGDRLVATPDSISEMGHVGRAKFTSTVHQLQQMLMPGNKVNIRDTFTPFGFISIEMELFGDTYVYTVDNSDTYFNESVVCKPHKTGEKPCSVFHHRASLDISYLNICGVDYPRCTPRLMLSDTQRMQYIMQAGGYNPKTDAPLYKWHVLEPIRDVIINTVIELPPLEEPQR